ncbi:hypothetical protein PG994_013737 [Apiospora phragmitis]|uniref:Uncharacterized protein n=1 Tax=Apiospora phragmitis TaxID=2905665 RepID=A0ABR1T9H4_9PEZI
MVRTAQDREQQQAWAASSEAPDSTHTLSPRPPPSLFASPSRLPPTFGLDMTRNPFMDPMSPEHMALVVDTLEKHRMLEVSKLCRVVAVLINELTYRGTTRQDHHGLAHSARTSARTSAYRRAMFKNAVLLCGLGILCVMGWAL